MGASRSLTRFALVGALLAAFHGNATAQDLGAVITGKVTSDVGNPLFGANVYITELSLSVQTNEAGDYRLLVPAARVANQAVTLRARFLGHIPTARPITLARGAQTVNFRLQTDVNRLEAIVTTGVTGATERAKVPFSVARVDASEMPVVGTSPLSQLQGKVPGANIISNSGRPGTSPSVILRGPTSINGSGRGQEPLYIVDGVVLSQGIGDLNPQDIESVEIVKGAAAASLYGSRAGAGVIQIKTRSGNASGDGVRFTGRTEYGTSDVERDFGIARYHTMLMDETGTRFCVFDAVESNRTCSRTIDYRQEQARINNAPGDFALNPPSFPIDPGAVTSGSILRRAFVTNSWPGATYNAVKQLVQPKPITLNNVSVEGRSGRTSFFASANNTQQQGAIRGLHGYQKNSGRVNVNSEIGEQWQISVNSFFSRADQDGQNQEEGGTGFFRLTRTPAIVDITQRDTLGRLYIRTNLGSGGNQNENPLYSFENTRRQDLRYRFIGGGTVRYTPLSWMDAEANFSYDRLNLNFSQFNNRGFRTTGRRPVTNNGFLFNGTNNDQSLNTSLQTTFRRQLASELAGRLNFRVLYEQQDVDFRNLQGNTLRVSDVDAAPNATAQLQLNSGLQSTRQISASAGTFLDFKDRYILDLLVRRDGSSRFGAANRWQTYGRGSASWLVAREPWWPAADAVSQFTVKGSVGTAGNVPRFSAQYETFSIGAGGSLSAQTLGNPNLRPEVVTETELGTEIELFRRFGLSASYARSVSRDQILPVPVPSVTGFPTQWINAGSLENKTLELSLNAPIVRTADLVWTGRLNYTRNRTMITKLSVPPFNIGTDLQATGGIMRIEEGLRYGTFFGRKFATSCNELPGTFQAQCGGPTSAFQRNDEGYIVWVGQGNNPGMGITDNLWNTYLPAQSGPWGVVANWGMPIILRDSTGSAQSVPLGNGLPDYRVALSQNVSYKRFTAYALLDGAYGQRVWNQGRHWSYLDFISHDLDQAGKSLQAAKPIGYYYRAPKPDNNSGLGGLYDILGPNNRFVEDASYMKLREVALGYRVGRVGGVGDWSLSVIGRNLHTWTSYTGFDPEVGIGSARGNDAGSAVVNAIDAFTFPNLRSYTFALSTTF
ncbi:MAG: hypothetical protein NVS1B4_16920 [Gemmatimonadaceae bacterium]